MNFPEFFRSLSATERDDFAAVAGTSRRYIEVHLVYGRKVPRRELMASLGDALRCFGADITTTELAEFFYDRPVAQSTAQVSA